MTVIFEKTYPRTLHDLVARYDKAPAGTMVEAWTFDDRKSRRAAELALASSGVTARFRSAYKPLLHFFLEEVEMAGLAAVDIAYPVHEHAMRNRFSLEAYPLGGLVGAATLTLAPHDGDDLSYRVALRWQDGRAEQHKIFAPNRVNQDFAGEVSLSPTAWVKENGGEGERLASDYERLFEDAMAAVAAHDWGEAEPYFEELNIAASIPARDDPVGFGEEVISLTEALHEEFYFSLLEVFQLRSGRPLGDRRLKPGQIVPEISFADGPASVRIETRPLASERAMLPAVDLSTAAFAPCADQVLSELQAVSGEAFSAMSRSGRAVEARYRRGGERALMISAGQHPNETTGIVGALRAAQTLAMRPQAHFTISPLENPDGYEIHRRLCRANPRHMHHAARYTALGDDLEYRERPEFNEKAIRFEAERLSGAVLHVNLHGYPSHEWTRPLSGYIPRGFALWTLPKGFFLILRHLEGWDAAAEVLIDEVTRSLSALKGVAAMNAEQIRLFELHAGETGFRIVNGFPCLISQDDRHRVPLTLITEYPDETIYGGAYVQGHTAQMQTVLAAYEALQRLELAVSPPVA